jgi:hypothetical protein
VRRRRHLEETIKLVGTPECLISEGLADLGLEVVAGAQAEPVVASHLHPLGVPFDGELAAQVRMAGEALGMVRGNAAIGIHDRGWTAEEASGYMQRWALLPKNRADKGVAFVTDPVWRAYPFCYTEGLRICRSYVGGDPARFERLITEPVVPEDLQAAT